MGLTGLLFLSAYAAGCAMSLIRHPIFGLVTYVAAFYLHPPSRWWGQALPDLRWSFTAAAVTLVSVLVHKNVARRDGFFRHRAMTGLAIFIVWIIVQLPWALDRGLQLTLLTLYVKYLLLLWLMYRCIDTETNLRRFLWSHVLGCLYMGWTAYTSYQGGRFEGFGGPDINEANAGAMQIVTGIFIASVLFLVGSVREKIAVFACMPLVVNALVTTISRGAFLAAGVGGVIFNYLTPLLYRRRVRLLSVLALILFVMLTNPLYWARIASLKFAGEEVEGLDTGSGRVVLMQAQLRMFQSHPFGCGHRCTAVLSPYYLDDRYLTSSGETRARSSHSTVLTMLVEHGIPGIILYALMTVWIVKSMLTLARRLKDKEGFLPTLVPGLAAALAAVMVGDLFVDYLKLEVRFWLIAVLMVCLDMSRIEEPSARVGPGDRGRSGRASSGGS